MLEGSRGSLTNTNRLKRPCSWCHGRHRPPLDPPGTCRVQMAAIASRMDRWKDGKHLGAVGEEDRDRTRTVQGIAHPTATLEIATTIAARSNGSSKRGNRRAFHTCPSVASTQGERRRPTREPEFRGLVLDRHRLSTAVGNDPPGRKPPIHTVDRRRETLPQHVRKQQGGTASRTPGMHPAGVEEDPTAHSRDNETLMRYQPQGQAERCRLRNHGLIALVNGRSGALRLRAKRDHHMRGFRRTTSRRSEGSNHPAPNIPGQSWPPRHDT